MKKIIVFFIFIFAIFSCGVSNSNKELVFNLYTEPRSIDPQKYSDNLTMQLANSLYEGLLRLDENDNIVGGLAEKYHKEDNKYYFTLRNNLKYSDGSEITLEDVKNGFLRVLNKENASQYAGMLFAIKNAKQYYEGKVNVEDLGIFIENNQLVIELENDLNYFPYLLTLPLSVPYKENLYNGPFELVSQNEQEIILKKNKNYWRSNEVELDNIKYVYFNDYSVLNNLIQNDDINISRVDSELLTTGINVNSYLNGRIWYLEFNLVENEILKNEHIRKAISLAINRDEYVKVVRNDGSIKALNLINEEVLDYKANYLIDDFNLENAKQELEIAKQELSLENIKIELLSGNSPIEIKEIQYLQESLSKNLGIEFSIKTVPYKDRLSLIRENKFDIALNTWSPKYKDGNAILDRFLFKSKKIDVFNQKEYESLLKISKTSIDNRLELMNLLEKNILEKYIVVPIYFSVENQYVSDNLTNVINHKIVNITDLSYIKYK